MPPIAAPITQSARDMSLDYLRATLTLMVVAHHSSLAYTIFARQDPHHYLASTAPVVDSARWLFLDYAENFNDVFFMSLMFFVSGLFVPASLGRVRVSRFLAQRGLRLGLPFAVGLTTIMPLAYYAAWRATGHDDGFLVYWRLNIGAHGWPVGPLWFVWVLLLFDALAALAFAMGLRASAPEGFRERPLWAFGIMLVLCAATYLPMLATFGAALWAPLATKPFYFQVSRIFLYLAWFAAGASIGAGDVERGLLARNGRLARDWRGWVAGGFLAYNLLVFAPRIPALRGLLSAYGRDVLEANLWVLSCVASSFGFLALFRGIVRTRRAWMDSLARSAYAIYLIHYVFVLWTQYALLGQPWPAAVKFAIVFGVATALSWLTAQVLLRLPGAARIL